MKLAKKLLLVLLVFMSFGLFACDELVIKTDIEYLIDALNSPLISYQENDNISSVTGNIILLNQTSNVTLSWKSDNENVISNDGVVNRLENNVIVKLTVTATYNSVTSLSKTFNLNVIGTNSSSNSNPTDNPTGSTTSIKISEAQAKAADTNVCIEGTIIGIYSKGFMVYDGTGAMLVYLGNATSNNVGDYVKVSGPISEYKGKMQFTNTCTIQSLTSGTDYNLNITPIAEGELDNKVNTLEYGQKITIAAKIDSVSYSYVNMSVTDCNTGVALAYYDEASKLSIGSIYNVTGLYMYSSEYNGVTSIYLMVSDISSYENYTISFDVEGISNIIAYKGVKVGELPTPEKFGYTFAGWYDEETLVNENTIFTKNTTLTAKFEEIILSTEQKSKVDAVINAIENLGDVSIDDSFKAQLEGVEKLYIELDDTSKLMVNNLDDLLAIRATFNKLTQVSSVCATFEFGPNGEEAHNDGSAFTKYVETVNGYSLTIENPEKVYEKAFDSKGNSCLKIGTSKAYGSFDFTVPSDINTVIIKIAGYKEKTVTVNINGKDYSITNFSDNGDYVEIEIDTTSTKKISFKTSTGYRAMINSISFVK